MRKIKLVKIRLKEQVEYYADIIRQSTDNNKYKGKKTKRKRNKKKYNNNKTWKKTGFLFKNYLKKH